MGRWVIRSLARISHRLVTIRSQVPLPLGEGVHSYRPSPGLRPPSPRGRGTHPPHSAQDSGERSDMEHPNICYFSNAPATISFSPTTLPPRESLRPDRSEKSRLG